MRRVFTALVAAACVAGALGATDKGATKAQKGSTKTNEDRPISILIEPGARVPTLTLFELEEGGEVEIVFEILYGKARFLEGAKSVSITSSEGRVRMPSIRPGPVSDETFIRLTVANVKIMNDIRVVTVPAGRIKVISETAEIQPAIVAIKLGAYAVVDESKLVLSDRTVRERVDPIASQVDGRAPSTEINPISPYYPPGCFDITGFPHCRRVPWGPGKVVWNMPNNPTAAGYSVKPEDEDGILRYPSWPPTVWQAIDGIYRNDWGCGVALKVQGNCTATVSTNQIECCCELTLWLLGYDCHFINPADSKSRKLVFAQRGY